MVTTFKWHGKKFNKKVLRQARRGLNSACKMYVTYIKQHMYPGHPPAPPGSPPAIRTGRLRRGITYDRAVIVADGFMGRVRSPVSYSTYLEYGTINMKQDLL